jgi:hypothetical protein
MELGDPARALHCYQGALRINPRMETIANSVRHLETVLRGVTR